MSETICMAEGATSPVREFTLLDGAGVAVHLAAASVTGRLAGLDRTYLAERAAVVTDAAAGAIQFAFIGADTEAPGLYKLEFLVQYADGALEVFPVAGPRWVDVRPAA